jgi:diguanylate cyclase (GGDEF)-like protein
VANDKVVVGALLVAGAVGARLGRLQSRRPDTRLVRPGGRDGLPPPPVSGGNGRPGPNGDHAAALQYLVDHDQLTGLRNRHGFERVLADVLAAGDGGRPGAVVKFGMDNFRHLNASRGRETCDLLLTSVASILSAAGSDAQAAARIGGDAFALLLPEAGRDEAEAVSRRVLEAVRAADLDVDHAGIRATMSAGITLLDRGGLTPGDVLLEADLAMARAKSAGRDRVAVYAPAELRPYKAAREWAEAIRDALDSGSLDLHCQPVRSLRTDHVQWELLVRLPQPDGQLLAPASFLPTAERFGLVERVDAWVLERACELVARHQLAGSRLDVEVNVSARSLSDERFAQLVAERLERAAIRPASLIFEVSESVALESMGEVRVFADRLKSFGCRFALDNFGTTHASLVHLKELPIDFVKIDGAFVRHLVDDEADRQIVRAIIDLAHGLGQTVIAAFVGDAETEELLRQYGADYVQGFHVGRPRPTSALT